MDMITEKVWKVKENVKRYLKNVVFCESNKAFEINPEAEKLYVVETQKDLQWLKSRNLPVVAWIHAGNKDQNLSEAFYAVGDPHALDMDFYERAYRREKKIPWDIVETERCLVREMIPEDGVAFEKIYEPEEIRKYMDDFHEDAAGEAAYIKDYQQQYRFCEYGVWSIILKDTGEVIGRAGFLQNPPAKVLEDLESGIVGILEQDMDIPFLGYVIGLPWQRKGLAEEVCKALIRYAREELEFEQIGLLVEKDNRASVKLAEKLGFSDKACGCQALLKVLHLM